MEKLKVNVIIAGRNYPLSVKNTAEEEGMRKAAKSINELIAKFEENYAVSDKQDVLAMCALQFASKEAINTINHTHETNQALEKIQNLTYLLEKHI